MTYKSIGLADISTAPHEARCEMCGNIFLTSSYRSSGLCQKCSPESTMEISKPLAKRITRMWGLNLA
jgi:Zn finger protein HypA/HybF involved in hydrogenase expression